MNGKTIEVTLRDVYGERCAYPANETARLFAQIAGTKTLKHETLALAERLGFAITEAPRPALTGRFSMLGVA